MREEIAAKKRAPDTFNGSVRPNLLPVFHYFIGAFLANSCFEELAKKWFEAGAILEEGRFFPNAFMIDFLGRYAGKLIMPDVAFADPRPFAHFSSVPVMKQPRERFITLCGRSMPRFARPLRIMDIGCGDGTLVVRLLQEMQEAGKIQDVGEVLLIDPSPALLARAEEIVRRAFPGSAVKTANLTLQEFSGKIDRGYDIALSSLAYHHMPVEEKRIHLERLKPWIDHLVLFELNANNDTPGLHSPELALSVYQAYGQTIDRVLAHEAPIEIALACVDRFLMTEIISFFTQPRGKRTDYHMLDSQWAELFDSTLGPDFTCLCNTACYADEYISLFIMHYGR